MSIRTTEPSPAQTREPTSVRRSPRRTPTNGRRRTCYSLAGCSPGNLFISLKCFATRDVFYVSEVISVTLADRICPLPINKNASFYLRANFMLCRAVPCRIELCCVALCSAVFCPAVFCSAVLCLAVLSNYRSPAAKIATTPEAA